MIFPLLLYDIVYTCPPSVKKLILQTGFASLFFLQAVKLATKIKIHKANEILEFFIVVSFLILVDSFSSFVSLSEAVYKKLIFRILLLLKSAT